MDAIRYSKLRRYGQQNLRIYESNFCTNPLYATALVEKGFSFTFLSSAFAWSPFPFNVLAIVITANSPGVN
jgi:hypothetical protein